MSYVQTMSDEALKDALELQNDRVESFERMLARDQFPWNEIYKTRQDAERGLKFEQGERQVVINEMKRRGMEVAGE